MTVHLTGGIQTTGNYPGKARTPEELMADMEKAMSADCLERKKSIYMHPMLFLKTARFVDRDQLEPKHFQKWVDFAKAKRYGH